MRWAGWGRPSRLLVLALLCVPISCERKQPQKEAAKPIPPFEVPQVDLAKVPPKFRYTLLAAQQNARGGPDRPELVAELASLYYVHGFPTEAVACFEHLTRLEPQNMAWWYDLGQACEADRKTQRAAEAYEQVIRLNPAYEVAYMRLASLLAASKPDRAMELYRQAVERNPRNPLAHRALGELQAARGQTQAAIESLQRAVQVAPNYAEAHGLLADLLEQNGQAARAAEHRRRQSEKSIQPVLADPERMRLLRRGQDFDIILQDIVTLSQHNQLEEIERLLTMAATLDEDDPRFRAARGNVRAMQQRYEEALADLQVAVKINPDMIATKRNLARVQVQLARTEEAIQTLQEILEARPDDVDVQKELAALRESVETPEDRIIDLQRAHEARPTDGGIVRELASLLAERGQFEQGTALLREYLETDPDDPRARFLLGALLSNAGELDQARVEWRRILATRPKFVDAYTALAATSIAAGEYAAAEQTLRDGLREMPDSAPLGIALARLLATCPDESRRNPQEAVELAEPINVATPGQNIGYLDTLAAAYAAAGRFAQAVEKQKLVLRLATEAKLDDALPELRARLELYQAGKPYFESP